MTTVEIKNYLKLDNVRVALVTQKINTYLHLILESNLLDDLDLFVSRRDDVITVLCKANNATLWIIVPELWVRLRGNRYNFICFDNLSDEDYELSTIKVREYKKEK